MSHQAERQAQAVRRSVKRQKEDLHGARVRDERGVSIWAELCMRAGELLKKRRSGKFVTERDIIPRLFLCHRHHLSIITCPVGRHDYNDHVVLVRSIYCRERQLAIYTNIIHRLLFRSSAIFCSVHKGACSLAHYKGTKIADLAATQHCPHDYLHQLP